jgi:prepilin-type N-terminal cleavage/methylation domain-containing protein
MTQRSNSTRRAAGFTLLEIMVSLAIGGIAISSMYAIGASTTRHFREQQRVSSTQTSVRSAMDQLKRDFQRAGFLATPNASLGGEACATPPSNIDDTASNPSRRLAAVSSYVKNATEPTSLDPDSLNSWDSVDRAWLMGNYSTSGEYGGITVAADGLTITIPMTSQSFRRDFTEWTGATAGQCNTDAFASAFPVGRLVRVHSLSERNFFSKISASSCVGGGPVTVTLTNVIPTSCNVNAGWIAPINTMYYHVENAPANSSQLSRGATNRVSVLRRTEVKPDDKDNPLTPGGTSVPLEDRSLLDFVVLFTVDFMMSQATPMRVNFAPGLDTLVRSNPEQIRGVIIEIAARTAEHEPEFFNAANGLSFRVLALPTRGAARVRRLRAELLMPNIAYRGL